VAASGFLHTACTCSSKVVLEQRRRFLPLHPRPRRGREREGGRGDKVQHPVPGATPKPSRTQPWGQEGAGLDPSCQPGACNRSRANPTPTSASATPGAGRKQISTEEAPVGKPKKTQTTERTGPITPGNLWEEGSSAFSREHPKTPLPLASPGGPASASCSSHRPPASSHATLRLASPNHKALPLPAVVAEPGSWKSLPQPGKAAGGDVAQPRRNRWEGLGNRSARTFEPSLFALSPLGVTGGHGAAPRRCRRGKDAMSEPSCPQWVGEMRCLSLGLNLGWKARILAGFQARSRSSSFPTPAGTLQGQPEPQRMQSTSAGHLPSPAPQTGNPSFLTFSFLGRHEDEASSPAGAGAGTHRSPKPQHGDRGHDRCIRGTAVRPRARFLPFPCALPAGQNEPGETEAAMQTSPGSAGMPSHHPPALLPRAVLPGRAPVPGAAPARWVFPPGAHVTALAKATTQQPRGDRAGAAARAGSTRSIITNPWLWKKTVSRL